MDTAVKPTPGSVQRSASARVPDPTPTGVMPTPLPGYQEGADQRIAELAYALWQRRGCPEGRTDEIWFEAERILKGE